jgi:hypothetical protein
MKRSYAMSLSTCLTNKGGPASTDAGPKPTTIGLRS